MNIVKNNCCVNVYQGLKLDCANNKKTIYSAYKLFCYSESGVVLTKMETGDFFGEIGILNLDGGINR